MSGMPPKEKAMAYIASSRLMAAVSPPGSPASSAASTPHRDAAMPEMRASPVTGLSWNSAPRPNEPGERPLGQPDITGGQGRPEHHHELVVVGQVALRAEPVMAADVRGQHLRTDDRLGLQYQAGGGQPGQRPERLQQ